MSIFGIIGVSMLLTLLVFFVFALVFVLTDCTKTRWIIAIITCVATLVCSILIGIGLTTENERIYVAQYEMQKLTIEQSLESDVLTGLERVELVNKAIELNGEFARRKASFNLWHHVHYDSSIYDNVDFISFELYDSKVTRND